MIKYYCDSCGQEVKLATYDENNIEINIFHGCAPQTTDKIMLCKRCYESAVSWFRRFLHGVRE